MPSESAKFSASVGEREIFFNAHVGGGAGARVLKNAPEILRALVIRIRRHVYVVNGNHAGVGKSRAGNNVQHCAFSRAVSADYRYIIAAFEAKIDSFKRVFFDGCAGVEGYVNIF